MNLPQPALTDVNLNLDSVATAIELAASNINAAMTADFEYKMVVKVDGKADIKIKNIGVDLEFGVLTQPGDNGELAPMLTIIKNQITINPSDVDITLSGSLVAKVASVLIPLIKNSVIPGMVKQIQDTITTTITQTIDPKLKMLTQVSLDDEIVLDLALTPAPVVTADQVFEITMNGTFFDTVHSEPNPYSPAAFSPRDPAGKDFQGYLTDYVVNTGLMSAFEENKPVDIGALFFKATNKTLSTDEVGLLVPEILIKYGVGKPAGMTVQFANQASKVTFDTTGDSLTAWAAFTITVGSDVALSAEFDLAQFAGLLNVKSGSLFGHITDAKIDSVSHFQTTLGLSAEEFLIQVSAEIDAGVLAANEELKNGIKIPSIAGFDLSDMDLATQAGFVDFGLTLTPAHWIAFQALVNGLKPFHSA